MCLLLACVLQIFDETIITTTNHQQRCTTTTAPPRFTFNITTTGTSTGTSKVVVVVVVVVQLGLSITRYAVWVSLWRSDWVSREFLVKILKLGLFPVWLFYQ